jgi:hypothetical protein
MGLLQLDYSTFQSLAFSIAIVFRNILFTTTTELGMSFQFLFLQVSQRRWPVDRSRPPIPPRWVRVRVHLRVSPSSPPIAEMAWSVFRVI